MTHPPDPGSLEGAVASEIGCGDCFAAADMMLGLGAKHVHLVEYLPLELMEENRKALLALVGRDGLPNRGELLDSGETLQLNRQKATYHQGLLENVRLPQQVDFLYSFDVLEHVEDLEGFFAYCGEVVRPGGLMVHKFDLSGHGLFEDPMPPQSGRANHVRSHGSGASSLRSSPPDPCDKGRTLEKMPTPPPNFLPKQRRQSHRYIR